MGKKPPGCPEPIRHSEQAEPVSEPTAAKDWRTNVCCGTPARDQYHVGQPWSQLCRVLGGVAGVLIQGVPGWGAHLTLPRILHPPSLHLPSAPSLVLAVLNSHSCHSTGGDDLFAYPSMVREQQQQQHTCPGYLDHQQPTPATSTTSTHRDPQPTFLHEPNLSRLDSSTVDPGLARPSFSTSGIQSRAAADELGPHSAFLASWRANLRVNPAKAATSCSQTCCWHRAG